MRYILHDTSAFDDEKISELFIEFGYEGIGLFWAILEKIGKQEKPIKTSVLKSQLKVGKKLEKVWNFLESIELICSNNGETFNEQLLKYSEKYLIKKEKNSKRISDWRDNQSDTKNVTRYEQICNTFVTPPNIIKDKKSKVNINSSLPSDEGAPILNSELGDKKEEKEKVAPKEKETTEHWKIFTDLWFSFYKSKKDFEPTFEGKESAALKSIAKKLKQQSETKGTLTWDAEYVKRLFEHFLKKAYADKWRKENFMLHILNSHFDAIIQTDENRTDNNQQSTNTGISIADAKDALLRFNAAKS